MTNFYQKSFNNALYKMRIAVSARIMDSEPLMRTLCKIMYDFSDELKDNGVIQEDKNYDKRSANE